MRRFFLWLSVVVVAIPAYSWSESGHHLVALLAFDRLTNDEQRLLLGMLAAHPRYVEDFAPPAKVRNSDRFRIGTAGYWSDIARSQPKYNRPNWHYQLGATLTMGEPAKYTVPETPGPCPETADFRTKDLYIAQAVELCRRVMADRNLPVSDRALLDCSPCRRYPISLAIREAYMSRACSRRG